MHTADLLDECGASGGGASGGSASGGCASGDGGPGASGGGTSGGWASGDGVELLPIPLTPAGIIIKLIKLRGVDVG